MRSFGPIKSLIYPEPKTIHAANMLVNTLRFTSNANSGKDLNGSYLKRKKINNYRLCVLAHKPVRAMLLITFKSDVRDGGCDPLSRNKYVFGTFYLPATFSFSSFSLNAFSVSATKVL